MHEKTEIYGIFKCSLRNWLTSNWEFLDLQLEIESWAKRNHLISIVVKFQKEKNEENKRLEDLWRKRAKKLKEDSFNQEGTYPGESNANCRPSAEAVAQSSLQAKRAHQDLARARRTLPGRNYHREHHEFLPERGARRPSERPFWRNMKWHAGVKNG